MAGNNTLKSQFATSNGETNLRSQIVTSSWVYHFGTSLKDLGKKLFAFSKFDKDAFKLLERLVGVSVNGNWKECKLEVKL